MATVSITPEQALRRWPKLMAQLAQRKSAMTTPSDNLLERLSEIRNFTNFDDDAQAEIFAAMFNASMRDARGGGGR